MKDDNTIIEQAKSIIRQRLEQYKTIYDGAETVKDFAILQLAQEKSETLYVMYLTTKHALIKFSRMFQGTINKSQIYPREIVRYCIELNAAAIILVHNHPSGDVTPSNSDKNMTDDMCSILRLIDVTVLDHIIVAGDKAYSFAEHGQL